MSQPADPSAPGRPLRHPVHEDVDEAMVRRVVLTFYARVRADPTLGPIFDTEIQDGWDHHLAKMCDFWSSVMLMTGRYKGKPMVAHLRLKDVRPDHFEQWLTLFRETARAECPRHIAQLFIDRAERIAESLQLGMFFQPHAGQAGAVRLPRSEAS